MNRLIPAIIVFCLAWTAPAKADWINLTGAETSPNIAEITIVDDRVKVALEIYIGDIKHFKELIPDDWLKQPGTDRPSVETRLRSFARDKVQIVTGSGDRLPVQLELVEARVRKDRQSPFAGMVNPYTRQRVAESPADKRVVYVELEYPFESKPNRLTIIPPLDEEGRPLVSIGFIAYHKAVPIIDFRYLGAPAAVNLDWDDPWYSKFDNPNLKRHHKSALMSYLYIEPYEVRHEILTRIKDLENWLDLDLRGNEYIEVDELEPLKQRVGRFLLAKNPVHIDGVPGKPILDRTSYVKVGLSGIQILDQPERLEISTAIIGVIMVYITDGMPGEVTADWELFTEQIQRVPATAVDPAGPLLSYVDPEDPVHKWTNFLKNYKLPTVAATAADQSFTSIELPLITIACVLGLVAVLFRLARRSGKRASAIAAVVLIVAGIGASPFGRVSIAKPAVITPSLSDADARVVLQSLLGNVYRAFDFREEDDVYDKLAHSVSGDLLADVYLQSRKSLQVQKAGGAQAKVKEVELIDTSTKQNPQRPLAYDVTARWSALGSVGHWGHVHTRKNVYDALITMDVIDGMWKISGLQLLAEKRVDPYSDAPLESAASGR